MHVQLGAGDSTLAKQSNYKPDLPSSSDWKGATVISHQGIHQGIQTDEHLLVQSSLTLGCELPYLATPLRHGRFFQHLTDFV